MTNYNRCKDTHNHNSSFVIPLAGSDRRLHPVPGNLLSRATVLFITQLAAFLQETGAGKNMSDHCSGVWNIILQSDHNRTSSDYHSWRALIYDSWRRWWRWGWYIYYRRWFNIDNRGWCGTAAIVCASVIPVAIIPTAMVYPVVPSTAIVIITVMAMTSFSLSLCTEYTSPYQQ